MKPDLIINPAAYTAVDRAEDERDLAFRINAEAPAAIAHWAARHNVPLIHFSTDYVFDGSGDKPWREDEPDGAALGLWRKQARRRTRNSKAGCRHLIVRTSWVYAAQGKNFLRTIARLAGERKELRIVADQFGAPTSARIIADAVVKILRKELSGSREPFKHEDGLLHLSASGEISWHGFADAIIGGLRRRGVKLETERLIAIATSEYPTKATRPKNSRLDHRRLNERYGIVMPSWQAALAQELDELTGVKSDDDDFRACADGARERRCPGTASDGVKAPERHQQKYRRACKSDHDVSRHLNQ